MASTTKLHASGHGRTDGEIDWKGYGRLIAMVLTSTVVMYFFMYLNIYRWGDFVLSETRAFMAMLMGGTMLAIMLAFMLHMFKSWKVNAALFVASLLLFLVGLYLVRSQTTVQDKSWMKSMIPHHSIAIMVSERAEITDPRVRKLADEIIAAQEKEISEMEYLIRTIDREGEVGDDYPLGEREAPLVGSVDEALASPSIASLDVGGMTDEEVARAVPRAVCTFRFSEGQQALLALAEDGRGVVKLMGNLVPVRLTEEGTLEAPAVVADGLRADVEPLGGGNAALVFDLATGERLRVGYDGVYECAS